MLHIYLLFIFIQELFKFTIKLCGSINLMVDLYIFLYKDKAKNELNNKNNHFSYEVRDVHAHYIDWVILSWYQILEGTGNIGSTCIDIVTMNFNNPHATYREYPQSFDWLVLHIASSKCIIYLERRRTNIHHCV